MSEMSRKERRELERALKKQRKGQTSLPINKHNRGRFLRNSIIIGGILLSLGTFFIYSPKIMTPVMSQQLPESYKPIIKQENALVDILALSHPIAYYKLDNEQKDTFKDHAQKTIATLKELRAQGLEDIIFDGLTDADAKNLMSNPRAVAPVGDQAIFIGPVMDYLTHSGWNIHGAEDSLILDRIQRHRDNITNIYNKHKIKLVEEIIINSPDITSKEFKLELVRQISKYNKMMSSEIDDYMSKNSDEFYDLVTSVRNKGMLDRVKNLVNSGKRVVLFGGSGHGVYLKEELPKQGIKFNFYADDPEVLQNTSERDKLRFLELETPPKKYRVEEIIDEVVYNLQRFQKK